MRASDPRSWMWSEAIDLLVQAERLHRQMFRPQRTEALRPTWEPPVDVFETEQEVVVFTALPGVDPETAETVIDDGDLVISGRRVLPPQLSHAAIHRLELPQGSFQRRVRIPAGRYDDVRRSSWNGCLVITLHKLSKAGAVSS
jgi:HSP20 family protein